MIFFGKKIPTEKINFSMNVVSFVLGIIFFIRMQGKFPQVPEPVMDFSRYDSIIRCEALSRQKIRELEAVRDSLISKVAEQENRLQGPVN